MPAFFEDLSAQVRVADLLDIGIIATLLYVTFVWMRDRASRSFAVITTLLAGVFCLARWLDLYMTTMVFHYGLVGVLLALVVVFQQDIRRGIESFTSSPWLSRSRIDQPTHEAIDVLSEAVAEMARERIGALLVFPGREPLGRHLRGGVPVDADLSKPLLLSIFHPKSPGHDGAVRIERNRVAELGLHLPLTTQVAKAAHAGTRHAAALGLSECSDALVIAVSEERGTISLARSGELSIVEPANLVEHLRRYFDTQAVDGDRRRRASFDIKTKLAALAVATGLWFLFAYQPDTIQRTFVAPIEYRNLPKGWEISQPKPTHVEVTLSGSEPAFALLNPSAMTVSLEVRRGDQAQVMRLPTEPNLENIPPELRVDRVQPASVVVRFREKPRREGPQESAN